jgi:hypothetical protein
MSEIERLSHLEIEREEIQQRLRGRRNPKAPRVRIRSDQESHAQKLSQDINTALSKTQDVRASLGIAPDQLVVLEFNILDVNQRDLLIRSFGVAVVEEFQTMDDSSPAYRLLVQFPTADSLKTFMQERVLFSSGSLERTILTPAQRRDLFNALDNIRKPSRTDRMGPRLKREGIPSEEPFLVDIDVWYDGTQHGYRQTEQMLKEVMSSIGGRLVHDLFRIPSLLLGKAEVNKEGLEKLLDLDIISTIDLPVMPVPEERYDLWSDLPAETILIDPDADLPLATIVDSGVVSGHPLLKNGIVVEERDFYSGEDSEVDMNGHGTGVAGIVVYGDVAKCLATQSWQPQVRICSAKVLCNDPYTELPVFPKDQRPEKLLEEAIRYFHKERGCRVFNLSIGNIDRVYMGGRQFPWAEMLDNLSRELDIVIVVSAGNVPNPQIPEGTSRKDFQEKVRNQLLSPEHSLIDPGTASICLVVGAIARREDPSPDPFPKIPVSPSGGPSVFTRTGFGVNKAVKPDLVAPGGNYALQQVPGNIIWAKRDINLGEPTLRHDISDGRLFRAFCGTSFAAPYVTHIAARVEHALRQQLERPPSANLIRAMTVNSASLPENIVDWLQDATDAEEYRQTPRKQEYLLRMVGYGVPTSDICWSSRNRVTLFAEDELSLNSFHLYTIRIPPEFLRGRFNKRIAISLAYDPVVRLSRKDYTAARMWFEVYRGLTPQQLEMFRRAKEQGEDIDLPSVPNSYKANFQPGYQVVQNSTVQLRTWRKSARGGEDLFRVPDGWNDPVLNILVAGKEQFPHPDGSNTQRYAIVVTFETESNEVELYNLVRERIRLRTRTRVRM